MPTILESTPPTLEQEQPSRGAPPIVPPQQNQDFFTTIAGVLGNTLEWYDFALFGFFSDIIAEVFFAPEKEGSTGNLTKSFIIFGSAFLMRPVGGLTLGYVGDKFGRKLALTSSLFLMAFPTFCMAFLPSYSAIGWLAPVLLLLCRMVQGVSVGGQLPASLVYTVERHSKERWGLYASLPMLAATCGSLLGNTVGATFRSILSEKALHSYGWRIPFLSGIFIAFVAIYLRWYGDDVHTNEGVFDQENSEFKNPITVACMSKNRLSLLCTAFACVLWAGGFYTTFVWMAIFMDTLLEPPVPHAFWVNALSLIVFAMLLPVGGYLSDKIGRLRCMTISAVSMAIWGPITLLIIGKSRNAFLAFIVQAILGAQLSLLGGPLCAWMIENFTPEIRLTSASLGYDIAHATAGGFSPAIATIFFTHLGKYSVGMLYPVFSAFTLTGIFLLHSDRKSDGIESDTGVTGVPSVSSSISNGNGAEKMTTHELELPEVS